LQELGPGDRPQEGQPPIGAAFLQSDSRGVEHGVDAPKECQRALAAADMLLCRELKAERNVNLPGLAKIGCRTRAQLRLLLRHEFPDTRDIESEQVEHALLRV